MKTLLIDDHALLRETLAAVMGQTWPLLEVLQAPLPYIVGLRSLPPRFEQEQRALLSLPDNFGIVYSRVIRKEGKNNSS
mgnify:CR=1 FL=1